MTSARKPQSILLFVAFIVFIDMMGIGLILPVMPSLITGLTGASIDRAAEIGGWLLFAYAMMQFLFAPVIGGLSDRFGRRPVLLTTLFLLGLDYAIMAWAPDLVWLFIGRIISGIMGASWAAANSCVADVAKPAERGKFFGILGGAGAFGFVIGPGIGGILGEYGDRLPFIAASILALVGTAIGILILKETLPEEKRRAFSITRANPLGSIIQMAKTPLVIGFLSAIFVLQLAAQAQIAVWAYWLIERFDWSKFEIGLSVALFGILLALVQGVLTGPVILKMGERRTALISLMFGIPAYLCFAFAPSDSFVYLGIVIGAASGFAFPAMQQMMSSRIDEDSQGELQGAVASMISLTAIFGPVVMTMIFGAYADAQGIYFPGAPFLVGAALMSLSIIIYIVTVRRFYGASA
ncbi:MFS transporter [Parasphingorhabdus sp.]|jgi:MFS transporter, DHA1 family, tetracycline resistance protein|uniref:MFS transporter n=1 Tax=Parasphingorhabdus sp. TaxID=2709688 RepID=UPI003BB00750